MVHLLKIIKLRFMGMIYRKGTWGRGSTDWGFSAFFNLCSYVLSTLTVMTSIFLVKLKPLFCNQMAFSKLFWKPCLRFGSSYLRGNMLWLLSEPDTWYQSDRSMVHKPNLPKLGIHTSPGNHPRIQHPLAVKTQIT